MKRIKVRKRNHIQRVSNIITGSLVTFLVVGLNGCDGNSDPACRDLRYAPQWKVEQCRNNSGPSSGFIPMGTSNYGSTHQYANQGITNDSSISSTKKSGFFGSSSSSSIGG